MALNCVEQSVREAVGRAWPGERMVTIGRCAVLTEPHNGRAACHYCAAVPSWLHHALRTSRVSTRRCRPRRPRAASRLRPWSVVHSITYDKRRGRATGVRVIDGQNETRNRVPGAHHLPVRGPRSNRADPAQTRGTGFANSSGQVGKNLMDHIMGGRRRAAGSTDRPIATRSATGPTGFYVPRFRNIGKGKSSFLRGYGFQGGGGRSDWGPRRAGGLRRRLQEVAAQTGSLGLQPLRLR